MKKTDRALVTVFLLLCMVFLSAVFAVQGSLLTAMIDAYRLTPARQGLANTMAFAGGVLALVCAFLLQGRQRKRTLLKIAGIALITELTGTKAFQMGQCFFSKHPTADEVKFRQGNIPRIKGAF